jgi:hypothetical protein
MSNKKIKTKLTDKNLQDDWIPDTTRGPESTSNELPEYGGDIKEASSIPPQKPVKK